MFVIFSSLNTLLALSVDRYIFIKKPLHYPVIMTGWKSILLLIFALSIGAIKTINMCYNFEVGFLLRNWKLTEILAIASSWGPRWQNLSFILYLPTSLCFKLGGRAFNNDIALCKHVCHLYDLCGDVLDLQKIEEEARRTKSTK